MVDVKTVALSCNNCGAGLALAEDVRFATCNHCGARLEIQYTDDATYTKVLEKVSNVAAVADDAAANIEVIKLERELEKINANLADLTDPGGFGLIWLLGGLAALGPLLLLSGDRELWEIGILDVVVNGGLAAWLGSGLRARINEYKSTKANLEADVRACWKLLDAARTRVATPGLLLPAD
jgi:hypothetical protein